MLKHLLLFNICACEICEKFVCKHSETIEYVNNQSTFYKNLQNSQVNNSRILRIKNTKLSGYCLYINTNIQGDFQINTSVPLRNGKVFIDVYDKHTNHHQYLHYLSAHPYCTKKSVVLGQTPRISRLCTSEKGFENHKEEMKLWFWKTEHPEDLINSDMKKVFQLRLKSNDKHHNIKGIP